VFGPLRQRSIDAFQAESSDVFVMMLSTRAGGVGITLTAADTCIIYDSDWNPQNDLQAQARCHRIGQTKSVKVYRLLTRKTYEQQMFQAASLKLGLDRAVLAKGGGGSAGGTLGADKAPLSAKELVALLKFGAFDVFKEEREGLAADASKAFCEADLDSILSRAKHIVHDGTGGGAASNTFSKASFVSA
ncbi:unnamed protein product, partial [Phaeothamnion confervicola]